MSKKELIEVYIGICRCRREQEVQHMLLYEMSLLAQRQRLLHPRKTGQDVWNPYRVDPHWNSVSRELTDTK